MADQPDDLHSNQGCILTVGVQSFNDRTACVMPFATDADNPIINRTTLCADLVTSFMAGPAALMQAGMSVDSYISYVQAEGMMDGAIPFRLDVAPGDLVGTRAGTTMPNNVAGLGVLYGEPDDIAPGDIMRVAKTFFPGVSKSDVVNDLIADALKTAYFTFLEGIQEGFASEAVPASKWYRVLAKASQSSFSELLRRTAVALIRKYVATQRRRMTPHA